MKYTMRNELGVPAVVDRGTFQAELDKLRAREKAHTREGDAIAAARRRLPMVEVDDAHAGPARRSASAPALIPGRRSARAQSALSCARQVLAIPHGPPSRTAVVRAPTISWADHTR